MSGDVFSCGSQAERGHSAYSQGWRANVFSSPSFYCEYQDPRGSQLHAGVSSVAFHHLPEAQSPICHLAPKPNLNPAVSKSNSGVSLWRLPRLLPSCWAPADLVFLWAWLGASALFPAFLLSVVEGLQVLSGKLLETEVFHSVLWTSPLLSLQCPSMEALQGGGQ